MICANGHASLVPAAQPWEVMPDCEKPHLYRLPSGRWTCEGAILGIDKVVNGCGIGKTAVAAYMDWAEQLRSISSSRQRYLKAMATIRALSTEEAKEKR